MDYIFLKYKYIVVKLVYTHVYADGFGLAVELLKNWLCKRPSRGNLVVELLKEGVLQVQQYNSNLQKNTNASKISDT